MSWVGDRYKERGIANVYIDGLFYGTADEYYDSYTFKRQQVIWGISGLSLGAHTIVIEVSGTKDAGSTAYNITGDAFDVSP